MRFFSSIRTKFALSYIVSVAIVLVLLNTYFLIASRDMIFASKLASVQNRAAILETALRDFDRLNIDVVSQVMARLDLTENTHITIVGVRGNVLYDTADSGGSETFFSENVRTALEGYDVLYTSFRQGVFFTSAFVPIVRGGAVTGSIYVHEQDAEQGAILLGLQTTVRQITFFVMTLSTLLVVLLLWTIMRRITGIVRAIASVREGQYTYRVELRGKDELAMLGAEFNSLTGRLRETDDIRRRFVADASHELKTPLASIRLLADSILQTEEMDTDTEREFVSDIGKEAERLARTTEKLMTLTRLDGGALEEAVPVELGGVVTATMRMLAPLAENMGLRLTSEIDAGCVVLASEDALHQIVFNLVENALKYNQPGGSVSARLLRGTREAVLVVDDTGIGVPEEDLPYIFDRFYRVDKARARAAGGSGLGLSIVQDTVRQYGGKVDAERRAGGGMRFSVRFKLYAEKDAT